MIKLMPTKTNLKEFLAVTQPAVDNYVKWSKQSLAYEYYGGPRQAMLEQLLQRLGQYFDKWATQIPGSAYHNNDGRGEGGGVTGPVCHFGDMPCYFSIRFFKGSVLAEVYRAQPDWVGSGCWRPGDRLYRVTVWNRTEHGDASVTYVEEQCFFGNILGR